MSLNPKQQRFCQEYVIDLNATNAAIRAGYSEKWARSGGAKLLANAAIQSRIAELQDERARRTQISADSVVERLAVEAFSSIEGIVTVENGEVKIADTKKLSSRQLATIQSIKRGKDGSVSVTMKNNIPALIELAKIVGLSSDLNVAIATFGRYGINIKRRDTGEWFVAESA